MRSGDRTAFIGIYPSTETAGTSGDPQPSWSETPQVECWAWKRDLTHRESVVAASMQSDNSCVFEVLYMTGITTKHRIKYGDRHFDITGISDPGERHAVLYLYASEGMRYGS